MANSFTTYYNLTKPEVGADTNAWGGHLNGDLDVIDSTMKSISDTASAALPKAGGTMTGTIVFAGGQTTATTSAPNIVQLTDSTSSTSTTTAATPNSVKSAYDLANAAVPKAGGTMTGLLVLSADPSAALGAATKQYVDLRALKATTITAGTGLTGGGDLSANRTIGISAGGVSATELASDAVTTAKILNANVTTAKIADANVTAAKLDGAQSGAAPIFGVRAWVKWSVSGTTVTVNASGNVTSVVRNSTGDYSITLTTGPGNTNYAVVATVAGAAQYTATIWSQTSTVARFSIYSAGNNPILVDPSSGHVLFMW